MRPYNLNDLRADLMAWMRERFLTPILYIEGGWETWLQVDFPAWLDDTREVQFNIRREQDLGGGRVDWLVNGDASGFPGAGVGVELKAQTHKYASSRLVANVLDDVDKLQDWVDQGRIERGISLAVAIDPSAASWLIGQGFVELFTFAESAMFLVKVVDAHCADEARC